MEVGGLARPLRVGCNGVSNGGGFRVVPIYDHVEGKVLRFEIGGPFRHRRADSVGSNQLLTAAIPHAVGGEPVREGLIGAFVQRAEAAHNEIPAECFGFDVCHTN